MLSKKELRWEAKKKKIAAFLTVAKLNDSEKKPDTPSMEQVKQATSSSSVTSSSKPRLPLEELAKLRAELKARQKANAKLPKVFLTLPEWVSSDNNTVGNEFDPKFVVKRDQAPLFTLDLQHLLLVAVQNQLARWKPRWCKLLRPSGVQGVSVIVVDSLSVDDFQEHFDAMPFLANTFEQKVEMISPTQYGKSVRDEVFNVPLSIRHIRKTEGLRSNESKVNDVRQNSKNVVAVPQNDTISSTDSTSSSMDNKIDSFSRVDLLLNPQQMIEEDYPMPLKSERYSMYVYSKDAYAEVTPNSPLYAVDCEMCITNIHALEVTRVSVVNEKLETVYDALVKPHNPIIDYVTRYSGITKAMMKPVTTRLEDVQKTLQEILPADAILCGQSLNGDLNALKMFHPYCIDTSVIYNLTGQRHLKSGLKRLTYQFLGREIQNSSSGHNSVEDGVATMELVLLKLKNGPNFGDVINGGVIFPKQVDLQKSPTPLASLPMPNVIQSPESSEATSCEIQKQDAPSTCTQTVLTNKRKKPDGNSSDESDEENNPSKKRKVDDGQEVQSLIMDSRKHLFFTLPGCKIFDCLFNICKECKKSVCIVDREESTDWYSSKDVVFSPVSSDKEAVKVSRQSQHFITWTHLRKFEYYYEETMEKVDLRALLTRIDKRIKKIVESLEDRQLVTVLFSGRTTPVAVHNAMCCIYMTKKS